MTKKHFNAIAEIIATSQNKDEIAYKMARFCKTQNCNFNTYRFLTACGVK